ncbi:MAG: hypothetical protein M3P48_05210 [Actinomycetota bacterium]|nr:hypothetical protein [Actinomycetota bacterium]
MRTTAPTTEHNSKTTTTEENSMPTDTLDHAYYCMPQPGQTAPRLEEYDIVKYADDGASKVGTVHCVRCMECSAISYDGVQPAWH